VVGALMQDVWVYMYQSMEKTNFTVDENRTSFSPISVCEEVGVHSSVYCWSICILIHCL